MPTSRLVLIAVIVALAFGITATLALRYGGRRRMEAAAGIRALAAMRWREFSQFVVTALQAQGFEAVTLSEHDAASRESTDLLLRRDQRTWLLACRQSPDYRITARHVDDMGRALRQRGAAGGVIATLGRADRGLGNSAERVELVDGPALWELISPLLPAGLQDHIAEQVQRRLGRAVLVAWAGALALGIAAAAAIGVIDGPPRAASPAEAPPPEAPALPAPPASSVLEPATTDSTPGAATIPGDDDAARQAILEAVNAVEGVDRSVWSTRSTLLVLLEPGATDVRGGVCAVLERYDALRASRVQLQPSSDSDTPVRFIQCRAY